ncbi:50S ribosomal protein L11 methyltransferase [Spirosoma aureum]|uniref:Ribosomal protein L11 methyltransferase n=1 Tax=Spirosoma aureum TaxID=2692134 RepID=A0A6G9AGC7_9BACT|nr:50S ribosomal protein L11 methyltransferase [Spirosoma aureum]QIP11510.1 50S ribosomal protein L11 methyltransferase [Spirosoma aureum]
MNYIELQLHISPDYSDILTAELAELGFESFVDTNEGLNAYIIDSDFDEKAVQELVAKYTNQTAIAYEVHSLEKRNWNAEWERDYEPIEVANSVRVRASFHQADARFRYDIIINPKMSFGTGHHETTAMMLEQQLGLDFAEKTVLDVGSGTGILAILAAKMGAQAVLAFDIEDWAVENARENAELNDCPQVSVFQGTIDDINSGSEGEPSQYDVVLANINRNVLLAEIPTYTDLLNEDGYLLVSGFYEHDAPDIQQKAIDSGLKLIKKMAIREWTSLLFKK